MMSMFFSSAALMIFSYSVGTPGTHVGRCDFMTFMIRSISAAGTRTSSAPMSMARLLTMVRP